MKGKTSENVLERESGRGGGGGGWGPTDNWEKVISLGQMCPAIQGEARSQLLQAPAYYLPSHGGVIGHRNTTLKVKLSKRGRQQK